MKRTNIFLTLIVTAILFTGCADASHVTQSFPTAEHTYGFFGGFWHGLIIFWDCLSQLWYDDVVIFAQNNNGNYYEVGFALGAGAGGTGLGKLIKAIFGKNKRKS